jgi:PAS domain S-box-containing protein
MARDRAADGDDLGDWRAALITALNDGVVITDHRMRVVDINPSFTALTGYDREGLPYPPPYPWFPDPVADSIDHAEVTRCFAEALEADGVGVWRVPHRHRDGRRMWMEVSNSVLPRHLGPDYHLIGVMRDVTVIHWSELRDRLLAEIGRILSRPGELPDQLVACARTAARLLDETVVIVPTTRDGELLPAYAAHPHQAELADAVLRLLPRRVPPELHERMRAGRAFILDPALVGPQLGERVAEAEKLFGRNSTLITPLVSGGRLHGILGIISTRSFDGDDERITAVELGGRIGAALAAERTATTGRRLRDGSLALAAAASVAQASAALASAVHESLNATVTVVYTPDPDSPSRLRLRHVLGAGRHIEEEIGQRYRTLRLDAETAPSEAARTGEPVWVHDQESWRQRYPGLVVDGFLNELHATFALPIPVGEGGLGAVSAMFATPWPFQADERQFVQTLATQAGLAFERATLADYRWHVSRTLQNSLLPAAPPPSDRLEVVTHYRPAGRDIHAGGDWHDVIALDDTRIAVVVGDVVGNGPVAAATMGRLSGALAAYLHEGHGPGAALDLLSDYARHLRHAPGSTAVCLILDTATGEVRGAGAGHPPPLLVDPAGPDCEFWAELRGPALGVPGGAAHGEHRRRLAPGSTVLLYSDGLVERRREVVDEGFARLRECAVKHVDAGPEELLAAVLAGCLAPEGPTDDVAVVIARYSNATSATASSPASQPPDPARRVR